MTPTQFLTVAGPASLFLGILGILEPGFSEDIWFDAAENILHTGFGLAAIIALAQSSLFQWRFVFWMSIFTLIPAVGGLLVINAAAPNFAITNLEHPLDNALHLTFVIVGFLSCMPKKQIA